MSQTPSQEILDEIRSNFDYFDGDKNGRIDVKEFTKLLQVIEPTATKEQAAKGFDFIDDRRIIDGGRHFEILAVYDLLHGGPQDLA